MHMRLELFVEDIERARAFYVQVLGFKIESSDPRGYTRLRLGEASIALNAVARIPKSHPARPGAGDRTGLGYEINLVVEGIEGVYAGVEQSGWEIAEPLRERPWGARDFCLRDPDDNYIRITTG